MQPPTMLACVACGHGPLVRGPCPCGSWSLTTLPPYPHAVVPAAPSAGSGAPRDLLEAEREKRRAALRRAAEAPAGWAWNPAAPLVDAHLNVTPNYHGLLAAVFARFDADRDGVLSLAELNALQAATGGEPLGPEALRELCAAAMPDFDAALDGGLSAVGLANLSLRSLLTAPAHEAAAYARLGFAVAPAALPTPAQRAAFAQLRAVELARRPGGHM